MPRAAIVLCLALGACASNPPINSFCKWFLPTDFTDPGVFRLNPDNKRALIVNEDTRTRECKLGTTKTPGGPR